MRRSTLDFALLGLLSTGPASGFDIRKLFQSTPLATYSDSPGSIYPALKRLEVQGLIRSTTSEQRAALGRRRRALAITAAGRTALESWLTTPVTTEDLVRRQADVDLRLALLTDSAPKAALRTFLRQCAVAAETHLASVRASHTALADKLSVSSHLALELGTTLLKTRARWYRRAAAAASMLLAATALRAQTDTSLLRRTYLEGERLTYRIRGNDNEDGKVTTYDATAVGVVRRDSLGRFLEDYLWSFSAPGAPPDTAKMHQSVSLAREVIPAPPDLRRLDMRLVGPALDFMTFYVDLWLAGLQPSLTRAGAGAYFPSSANGAWTDGRHVILGEDAIDFDMSVASADGDSIVLVVWHVPPGKSRLRLPASWMETIVDSTPRPKNWVEVTKETNGATETFLAAVGRETFGVRMTLRRADGRILRANMVNSVFATKRVCADAALQHCGAPHSYHIKRRIDLAELP